MHSVCQYGGLFLTDSVGEYVSICSNITMESILPTDAWAGFIFIIFQGYIVMDLNAFDI